MSMYFSLHTSMRRSLAVAVVAGSALALAGAQTAPAQESAATAQPVNFAASAVPQIGPGADALVSSSSDSSSSLDQAGTAATQTNLASLEKNLSLPGVNAQYGRRRYGAPRYRGGNTNADGSEKWTAYGGAGFTLPVSGTSDYLTTSYGIQAGVGRNWDKHFGVNLEFDYDRFGLTGATIQQQNDYYFDYSDPTNSNGLDGNNHIWNFSIQPILNLASGEKWGAYITGGVGFYHKVTNFTLPQEEEYCDPYYGCGVIEANGVVDHYTSNAPGFDGGFGVTYKFSHFSNERFFAEFRYVYIDNSYRPGVTVTNYPNYTGNNYFPANSLTTSYMPVKFGIRF